ncbi:MAG: nuclear transport factor 2 family protein [Croceibacterium sp.]
MRKIVILAAIAALFATPAAAETLTPEQVIRRHIGSGGNLDAIMADYADDAVVFQQGRAIQGKAAIRELFQRMLPPRPSATNTAPSPAPAPAPAAPARPAAPPPRIWQEGEVGFMVAQFGPNQVTEQYLVRQGKIVLQAIYTGAPPPSS